MDENSLLSILQNPNESGYVTFIISAFLLLSLYNLFLYLQNKDKTYLFYSIYTILVFLSLLKDDKTVFLNYFFSSYHNFLNHIFLYLVWAYNSVYLLFVFSFVNLKFNSKKWNTTINIVSYTIISFSVFEIFYYYFTDNRYLFFFIEKHFIAFLFVFSLICYYPLLKYKAPLKKYLIVGSIVIFIASFFAVYGKYFYSELKELEQTIFLTGIIIENLIFAVALSKKQKMVLEEKNTLQYQLISQLKENEKLRKKNQEILEKELETHSERADNEKIKTLEAEFESKLLTLKISSLRSQMNPHFIFNSLNSIKLYIIENEKNNAIYYLNKFSKLIRKILASTREESISLSEEIETLSLYTEIENIRFSNEIITSINVDENLNTNTIKIPSLLLQPFIENAIWHGLSSKEGDKILSVSFNELDDDFLKITITDNGIGREKSAELKKNKMYKKDSIGIQLTEDRLKNFSLDRKGNYSINIIDLYAEDHQSNGTKVEITIPLV